MTTLTKKQTAEAQISLLAGVPVELTIRGKKEFTFSFEGKDDTAMQIILNYFKGAAKSIKAEYHKDIDYTVIFLNA